MGKRRAAREEQEADQAQQQQQQYAQAPPPPPQPAQPAGGLSDDAMARLRELGQLHEQGVLTDEEFAQQKAKLLG